MRNASFAVAVLSLAAAVTSCTSNGGSSRSPGGAGDSSATGGAPGGTCGNGLIESGETCDPSTTCPTGCDDGDACTFDQRTGSADTCNVACSNTRISACSVTTRHPRQRYSEIGLQPPLRRLAEHMQPVANLHFLQFA